MLSAEQSQFWLGLKLLSLVVLVLLTQMLKHFLCQRNFLLKQDMFRIKIKINVILKHFWHT